MDTEFIIAESKIFNYCANNNSNEELLYQLIVDFVKAAIKDKRIREEALSVYFSCPDLALIYYVVLNQYKKYCSSDTHRLIPTFLFTEPGKISLIGRMANEKSSMGCSTNESIENASIDVARDIFDSLFEQNKIIMIKDSNKSNVINTNEDTSFISACLAIGIGGIILAASVFLFRFIK